MKTQLEWKTEKRKVKDLIPLDKNPRKITKQAMAKLKDRITKRGMHDVIKVDTAGVVLSGNMRTQALTELGITEVEVMYPDRPLTPEERDAIVLESNKNDGTWDQAMLPEFGQEVLLEAGFETVEVDLLMHDDEDEEDPFNTDKSLESIKEPTTKKGNMFQLGDNFLLCGDSTSEEDVKKLMGGVRADMVFCDPPFNVNYESKKQGKIMNDFMEEEKFIEFCTQFVARMKESTKSGAPYYICSGYSSYPAFLYALRINQFIFSTAIIWVKNQSSFGFADYKHKQEMILKTSAPKPTKTKKSEPLLYGWNNGSHYFPEMKYESDVWEISRVAGNTMQHPTQKPIALINRAVKNSSKRGDVVLDLFAGSGSTLISAMKTGRRAYLMELDPKFCDVIINRWEALTGERAKKL